MGFFLDDATGLWRIEGVKAVGEAEPELVGALAIAAMVSGVEAELVREATPAEGWLARTHAAFPEQPVGRRFAVRGTHLAGPPMPGRITLSLDAGLAFGSGEHGSTRGCLIAFERVAYRRPRRILDLGTGSGILAMAAARLLHRRVLASDIDPWSVRVAAENAALNACRGAGSLPSGGWLEESGDCGRPGRTIWCSPTSWLGRSARWQRISPPISRRAGRRSWRVCCRPRPAWCWRRIAGGAWCWRAGCAKGPWTTLRLRAGFPRAGEALNPVRSAAGAVLGGEGGVEHAVNLAAADANIGEFAVGERVQLVEHRLTRRESAAMAWPSRWPRPRRTVPGG